LYYQEKLVADGTCKRKKHQLCWNVVDRRWHGYGECGVVSIQPSMIPIPLHVRPFLDIPVIVEQAVVPLLVEKDNDVQKQ
jgi:hypothetical protein